MSVWSKRRQVAYFGSIALVMVVVVVAGFLILRSQPSCYDGKQNGTEIGIDCGGDCQQICLVEVQPLRVSWTRVFPIGAGAVYAVSLVENPNTGIGIKRLPYTIRLTDNEGLLVATREGNTFVNPREKFIIFEGGIETGSRVATRGTIQFGNDFDWRKVIADKPAVLIEKRSFTNDVRPRLEIGVTNNSIYRLKDIKLAVILSDQRGNAFAGSATVVDSLAKSETKTVVFTWPTTLPQVPAAIDVYPRVDIFNLP